MCAQVNRALAPQDRLYALGMRLNVVPTPRHLVDLVCLVFTGMDKSSLGLNRDSTPEPGSLILTANIIVGQGKAVFEDLAEYMAPLERFPGL